MTSQASFDACFAYLRRKRQPRLVIELMGELVLADAYCAFSKDDLVAALRGDVRFVVEAGREPHATVC